MRNFVPSSEEPDSLLQKNQDETRLAIRKSATARPHRVLPPSLRQAYRDGMIRSSLQPGYKVNSFNSSASSPELT